MHQHSKRLMILAIGLTSTMTAACTSILGSGPTHEALNAALWMQTSAEYEVATVQAYRFARERLDEALEPGNEWWTASIEQASVPGYSDLPPAVIVDVDDSVLATLPFQVQIAKEGVPFRKEIWKTWVRKVEAPAVPGAFGFAQYAVSRGVEIFYVTNREVDVEEPTLRNLAILGFPTDPDGAHLLMRGERPLWDYDKRTRREAIAAHHRIVLLIGDDLNDFVSGSRARPWDRVTLARRWSSHWGSRWILLPNPVYGGWERATFDFERGLSPDEILEKKIKALE